MARLLLGSTVGGKLIETVETGQVRADLTLTSAKTYTNEEIAKLVASAPGTLDTLKEIATALANDPNFATTMTTELGKKANSLDVYTKTNLLTSGQSSVHWNNITNAPSYSLTAHNHTLDSLSDVAMTTKVVNHLIKWNGTKWINSLLLAADIPNLDTGKITTGVILDARLPNATTAAKGTVQLSSAVNSTSAVLAATPAAVKLSYDLANAALPQMGGTVTGRLETQGGIDIKSSGTSKKFTIEFNETEQSLDFIYA